MGAAQNLGQPALLGKICTICGRDVANEKRTKDTAGRYYCAPCYAQAAARASSPAQTPAQPKARSITDPSTATTASPPSTASKAVSLLADLSDPTYANSPILRMSRQIGAKLGWNPVQNAARARVRTIVVWTCLAAPVLVGGVILAAGTRVLPENIEQYRGVNGEGPNLIAVFVAISCMISFFGFIPLSITLIGRLVPVAIGARTAGARWVSISASVLLLLGIVLAWPRLSEAYGALSSGQSVAFASLDSKFGLAVFNNPSQFGKTSEQIQSEAASYLGAKVRWTGVVTDVRDGQVLIQMRKISLQNDVVLKVGWWDEWRLEGIKRDDLINFSGILAAVGSPYAVTNGLVKSSRSLAPGELKRPPYPIDGLFMQC